MGVRGLTTYIAANAERFLEPYELHDTDLVIDGDNLCIQLFVRSEERMGAFGGNYDHYFRAVVDFFELLKKCAVRAWVLLDGGYERSKLKTVRSRLLGRIHFVKNVRPGSNRLIIPLFIREVFVDALRAVKVPFMRCLFEADNEVAILARKLDCPVLSYDSDFYIHNVKYIPYVTVNHKIYRKVVADEGKYEIELVGGKKRPNRVLAKQGDGPLEEDNVKESFCYLDCSMYTIENLIGSDERLKPEMLPLFAALLGNDYISRGILSRFYASMKVGKISRKVVGHQRRVVAILKWLKHHSLKSATTTIVNQVREKNRDGLLRQLEGAMYGYNCEECTSYGYFGFVEEEHEEAGAGKFREYLEQSTAEDEVKLVVEAAADELVESDGEVVASDDGGSEKNNQSGEESSDEEEDSELTADNAFNWEPWLLDIYQAALTPRFVVDLYHSSQYINYPQVEDLNQPDSNEICYELLKHIFALLKSGKRATNFRYLTRCERVAQLRWLKFENVELPREISFNPNKDRNMPLLKVVFEDFANQKEIFEAIPLLPVNIQLYFLSVIFWITKIDTVTCAHVHALIVCLIQLQMIDKRLPNKSRDANVFQRNQKSYLENQRKSFRKTEISVQESLSKTTIKKLSTAIGKPEAILTYDLLLPHFSINDRHLRKHGELDRPTAHVFAQLQAVVLNLFTLNGLLRHPFEPTRMHECYNGVFLQNIYHAVRSRQDTMEYIRGTVFRYSATMFAIHRLLYEWVVRLVPQLEARNGTARATKGARKAKQQQRKREPTKQQVADNDCLLEGDGESSDDKDEEGELYNDLNNQFSQLLLSGQ
ncbi:protein asteroid [Ochlerotatus camptorhynchus]|uniref:protein asteroid n=1 Tax=Ochlerotatus camptorhynchus TaxID=644619 RepID=UPI0031DE9C95